MPAYTREALYDLVWSEPVRTIAQRLAISDVGLKKVSAKANIAVPQRGYWAKLASGKPVTKARLAPRAPGAANIIQIGAVSQVRFRWPPDPETELAEPEPTLPIFEEPLESVEARVRKSIAKVSYLRSTEDGHPQIRKLIAKDEERQQKQLNSPYPMLLDAPLFDAPFERRRLKILNSIFVGLSRVAARVDLDREGRRTSARVGDTWIYFSLDSPKPKNTARRDEPNVRDRKHDVLQLEITSSVAPNSRSVWADFEGTKLESHLTEIVVALVVAAEVTLRDNAARAHRHALERREKMRAELAKRRAEAERKERERIAAIEKAKREKLIEQARDWRTARDLRDFVRAVTEQAGQDAFEAIAMWRAWALDIADGIDPLVSGSLVTSAHGETATSQTAS